MQSLKTLLLALGLTVLASGCFAARSDINTPLDPARLDALELGTSARDVVAALGAPTEVVQLGLRSAYLYEYTRMKRAGLALIVVFFMNEDTKSDRAWLFFDEANKLTHVGTTLEAKQAEFSLPFE